MPRTLSHPFGLAFLVQTHLDLSRLFVVHKVLDQSALQLVLELRMDLLGVECEAKLLTFEAIARWGVFTHVLPSKELDSVK